MAQRFNPAPGWPTPPPGWTPPPNWTPDPSWPPAPEGWQFWVDDASPQPTSDEQSEASEPLLAEQTTAFASPQPPEEPQQQQAEPQTPASNPYAGAPNPYANVPLPQNVGAGGPGGPKKNTGIIITLIVLLVLLLGGLVWVIFALVGSSGESKADSKDTESKTTEEPAEEPTEESTEDPDENPSEELSEEPTEPTEDPWEWFGELIAEAEKVPMKKGDSFPYLYFYEEYADLTVTDVDLTWEPASELSSACQTYDDDRELVAVHLEVETTDALTAGDEFPFSINEMKMIDDDGNLKGNDRGYMGDVCLEDDALEMLWEPETSYSGWVLMEKASDATVLSFTPISTDSSNISKSYQWDLSDF